MGATYICSHGTKRENDIRQYGTVTQHQQDRPPPPVLQPTQTIGKYRQQKLLIFVKQKATTPTRAVLSPDLRKQQLEIEQ